MNFDAVVVATFESHALADAAVSLLQSEDIEAAALADDAGGELPNLDTGSGVRVVVPKEHAEFARALLNSGTSDPDPDSNSD